MKKQILIIVLLLLSSITIAQNEIPQNELGAWYILATNSKVSEKMNVVVQAQFRFYEMFNDLQQLKIRSEFVYKVAPNYKVGLGYAYFRNDPSYNASAPENFNDHRLVFDNHLTNKIKKLGINHRYRFEQRFTEDREDRLWLSYLLKFSYPISEKIKLDIYDEVYLNLTIKPIYSQNWIGGGVSYVINERLKGRLGYQSIQSPGADFNRILMGLNYSLDFTQNNKANF